MLRLKRWPTSCCGVVVQLSIDQYPGSPIVVGTSAYSLQFVASLAQDLPRRRLQAAIVEVSRSAVEETKSAARLRKIGWVMQR